MANDSERYDNSKASQGSGGYNSSKAAKGQAYNLAVHEAISLGKHEDINYILKRFLHYYKLGTIIQEVNLEDLEKELAS